MSKILNIKVDEKLESQTDLFTNNVKSNMYYKSETISDIISPEWLDELEFACPYLDNIFRNPKVALIQEEDVVKIERAKKISVASVKDLSKHTHYIEKINEKTQEVQPSKILITRNEETFNTYENRFLYTLLDNLVRFVAIKERALDEIDYKDDKTLEYKASTFNGKDSVNIELKINSKDTSMEDKNSNLKKEIESIRTRLKLIKEYISRFRRSEMVTSLSKANVPFLRPPIRKTNLILKNPNFQIASRLWAYLQMYDYNIDPNSKDGLDSDGDNVLKGILEDSFLIDYYVLDSISSSKKAQKEKLAKYAMIMIVRQLERAISLLMNKGIKVSDEDLLTMLMEEVKRQREKKLVGTEDVKKKFKTALEEYLERTQDYL